MAIYQVLYRGFDPTASTAAISRAQLLQMVHEAQFVDYVGGVIYADSAPDVVTYPKLAWFIWHKTNSLVPTGETYYWDGSEWTPQTIKDGTLTGDAFADGSIDVVKIKTSLLDALKILRVNSGGTSIEFVTLSSLLADNSIGLTKLANALTAGRVIYSGLGGVWQENSFASLFASQLGAAGIPVSQLYDNALAAAANDVVCFTAAGEFATLNQVKNLIANNTLPTNKLVLSGFAGKLVRVNAAGTDLEAADVSYKVATIKGTAAQGVDGPIYTGVGPHLIVLDSKNDPSSFVKALASSEITLGAGTYELDLVAAFDSKNDTSGDNAMAVQILLYAGVAIVDHVTVWTSEDANGTHFHYKGIVTPVADTVYKFMFYNVSGIPFHHGVAANVAGRGEVYSQLVIRKI